MPQVSDFARFAFIVGAPRCGTTTMAKMLRAHPQVAAPFVKEPHFFSQHDLRGLTEPELRAHVERDYLARFFTAVGPDQRVATDGSVSYLYTPEQMEPLLRLWPDSRFIIAVRDPITMLPSLHRRLIYIGDETIPRFEDAWAATALRAAGRQIPRSCIEPRWLRYDEAGRLGTYVERFFATVGRERCLVVVFDDFAADPQREYRRILDFIGVEPVEPIEIPVERQSRGVRHPWLQRLLKRPPKALQPYIAGVQYRRRFNGAANGDHANGRTVEKIISIRKQLLHWNGLDEPKPQVALRVQREIQQHLQDEIDRLGALIGRDLSHWVQPRSGSSSDASP